MDDDSGDEERGKCVCCGRFCEPEKHRLNFMLWEFAQYRKPVSKNRNGVVIEVSTKDTISTGPLHIEMNSNRGEFKSELLEKQMTALQTGITYTFKVVASTPIYLMHCHKLHPYPEFIYTDCTEVLSNGGVARLEKNAAYTVQLKCVAQTVGKYKMPISFRFQTLDNKNTFSIVKEMVIEIFDSCNPDAVIPKGKSPFTNKQWNNVYTNVEAVKTLASIFVQLYSIPLELNNTLMSGVHYWNGITATDTNIVNRVRFVLNERSREHFRERFHYLLWLDEMGAILKIHCYNMENVRVTFLNDNTTIVLEVPGLAEKRPSLVKGDQVKMREHDASVMYCGTIKQVCDQVIWIHQISPEFIRRIQANPTGLYDVQFDINRLTFERMHKAVDLCSGDDNLNILFPSIENNKANKNLRFKLTKNQFKNEYIRENEEQQQAVLNILNGTSGNAPYLVFGPPGTGKTVTIVEAIYQLVQLMPHARVLVCAPANAACDMLVVKLSEYFTNQQLIRIHSDTADWKSVPRVVKDYSNRSDDASTKISGNQLQNYRIVVTTLMSTGKYAKNFTATHVFIDEAAQALEPEGLIAVGGILAKSGQLVLAGDPKQLGPSCNSKAAEKYGLGVSLLDKLMAMPLYTNMNGDSEFFITKLILNYRNHPDILHLPNELFYESELRAVSDIPIKDCINQVVLPVNKSKAIKPQAIEFYGVNGEEQREGKSPSFFNSYEIQVVMRYLQELTNPQAQMYVPAEEIGVITPYIRQVYRIRERLKDDLKDVEVGTTETFQGREKRVIIISTVRAKASLLLHDAKYCIGFVSNPQRFNVAVTRAISKLIIIGNPHCLGYDEIWLKMINFCQSLGSYRGCYFAARDAAMRQRLIGNMKMVEYKPKGNQNSNANSNQNKTNSNQNNNANSNQNNNANSNQNNNANRNNRRKHNK